MLYIKFNLITSGNLINIPLTLTYFILYEQHQYNQQYAKAA